MTCVQHVNDCTHSRSKRTAIYILSHSFKSALRQANITQISAIFANASYISLSVSYIALRQIKRVRLPSDQPVRKDRFHLWGHDGFRTLHPKLLQNLIIRKPSAFLHRLLGLCKLRQQLYCCLLTFVFPYVGNNITASAVFSQEYRCINSDIPKNLVVIS